MTILHKAGLQSSDLFLAVSLVPILGLVILDPGSFTLGWNEGRGGFVFALLFLLMEWYDARSVLKLQADRSRLIGWSSCLVGFITYFVAVYALSLHELIGRFGENWKIPELHSWVWLWDYLVFAIFLIAVFGILFGIRSIKEIPTGIVYTVGSGVILMLDSFFPYGSISFLAGMVPLITNIVVALLGISGVHIMKSPYDFTAPPSVYLTGNFLWMQGIPGNIVLQINWPCMGVFSMLIYTLIMAILMVKLDATRKRKVLYFLIGAVGTFFINIFRIFLIAYYVAFISIDVKIFHENIGEFLFLGWVVLFLLAVVKAESKFAHANKQLSTGKGNVSAPNGL